jgi:hypothetical protein
MFPTLDILTSNSKVFWFNPLSPLWGLLSQINSSSGGTHWVGYFKPKLSDIMQVNGLAYGLKSLLSIS